KRNSAKGHVCLYPRKRTCAVQLGMSALGQKRTSAAASRRAPCFFPSLPLPKRSNAPPTVSAAGRAMVAASMPNERLNSIWVRNDVIVPIRHFHLRQRLCVNHVIVADELVQGEDIRGERIDF